MEDVLRELTKMSYKVQGVMKFDGFRKEAGVALEKLAKVIEGIYKLYNIKIP